MQAKGPSHCYCIKKESFFTTFSVRENMFVSYKIFGTGNFGIRAPILK